MNFAVEGYSFEQRRFRHRRTVMTQRFSSLRLVNAVPFKIAPRDTEIL
jgi:hypothetical protein